MINTSGQKIDQDLPQKCIISVPFTLNSTNIFLKSNIFLSNALQSYINDVTLLYKYYFIYHDT